MVVKSFDYTKNGAQISSFFKAISFLSSSFFNFTLTSFPDHNHYKKVLNQVRTEKKIFHPTNSKYISKYKIYLSKGKIKSIRCYKRIFDISTLENQSYRVRGRRGKGWQRDKTNLLVHCRHGHSSQGWDRMKSGT